LGGLRLDEVAWFGKLDNVEFLRRLFDLQQLLSTVDLTRSILSPIRANPPMKVFQPSIAPEPDLYGSSRVP
jgi:hypothetical protein